MTTKTTTEIPSASGGRAVRAGLIALLAGTYLVAWWGLGGGAPPPRTAAVEPPPSVAGSGGVVWYGELPPAERPAVALPPGWRIAQAPSRGGASAGTASTASTRPARARPQRLRTRSS